MSEAFLAFRTNHRVRSIIHAFAAAPVPLAAHVVTLNEDGEVESWTLPVLGWLTVYSLDEHGAVIGSHVEPGYWDSETGTVTPLYPAIERAGRQAVVDVIAAGELPAIERVAEVIEELRMLADIEASHAPLEAGT